MSANSNNAYRLFKLLLDGGTYFARELILQEIDRKGFTSVDNFLNDPAVTKKLNVLQQRKILKKKQMDLLYPRMNKVQVDMLDITLLTCILTNCLNLNSNQDSAVQTLREFRNDLFGHSSAFVLSDQEFAQNWKDVANFLLNESKNQLGQHCFDHLRTLITSIEGEILTPTIGEKYIDSLKQWQRTQFQQMYRSMTGHLAQCDLNIESLRRHLVNKRSDVRDVELWQQQSSIKLNEEDLKEKFNIEVKGQISESRHELDEFRRENAEWNKSMNLPTIHEEYLKDVYCTLKRERVMVLQGIQGSGKTHFGLLILCRMEAEGFTPLIIRNSIDLIKMLDTKCKYAILLDDIFGRYYVDQHELQVLNQYVDRLLSQINQSGTVLLFTMRLNVIKGTVDNQVHEKLLTKATFVIKNDVYIKNNMLRFHANRKGVTFNETDIETICQLDTEVVGFPLLSSKMDSDIGKIVATFQKPIEYIKNELNLYGKTNSKEYCLFLLVLLTNNCLDPKTLDDNTKLLQQINEMCSEGRLCHSDIKCQLDTYLQSEDGLISFLHDVILEAFFETAYKYTPSILISNSPIEYINKFTSYLLKDQEKWDLLLDRLSAEQEICLSKCPLLDNLDFIGWILRKKGTRYFFEKRTEKSKTMIEYLCVNNSCNVVRKVLLFDSHISHTTAKKIIYRVLKKVCTTGRADMINILIKEGKMQVSNELMFLALESSSGQKVIQTLFQNGCDIMAKNKRGENILQAAVSKCRNDIVSFLSSNFHQDIKKQLREAIEETPDFLFSAVRLDAIEILKIYVKEENTLFSSVNLGYEGKKLIHVAAEIGTAETLKCIIDENDSCMQYVDSNGFNPLHYAALSNSIDNINVLIQCGISPQSVTKNGINILQIAVQKEYCSLVEFLLERYPKLILQYDNDGWFALHYAASGSSIECLKILIQYSGCHPLYSTNNGSNILHVAAGSGSAEMLEYIVQTHKELLNTKDFDGWNALHYCCKSRGPDELECIKNAGIPIDSVTFDGMNILHIALNCSNDRLIEYIIETHSYLLETLDSNGWHAIHFAARSSSRTNFDKLIEAGCDPLRLTDNGDTILHMAAEVGDVDFLDYIFLRFSKQLQELNTSGCNALHIAIHGQSLSCVEYLLNTDKYNHRAVTFIGSNILHIAAAGNNVEVLRFLTRRFPDLIMSTDYYLNNMLHYAIDSKNCNMECLEFLKGLGISMHSKNLDGSSALDLVIGNENKLGLHLLQNYYTEPIISAGEHTNQNSKSDSEMEDSLIVNYSSSSNSDLQDSDDNVMKRMTPPEVLEEVEIIRKTFEYMQIAFSESISISSERETEFQEFFFNVSSNNETEREQRIIQYHDDLEESSEETSFSDSKMEERHIVCCRTPSNSELQDSDDNVMKRMTLPEYKLLEEGEIIRKRFEYMQNISSESISISSESETECQESSFYFSSENETQREQRNIRYHDDFEESSEDEHICGNVGNCFKRCSIQ